MGAVYYVGDAISVMGKLPEKSVDLVLTSPPFLALRSYLPADHPDKHLEGGSQSTPGAYIDWLVDVVEACARILAPHGSLCFELGDTYSGSGGAGGDYAENGWREGQPTFRQGKGSWPLAKSLSLIPELFRYTLVYGTNPLTGRQTERWRLRNVIRWVRPNPPVGALGDKFRPATSELMVFCKSAKRFFDLDAVREPHKDGRLSSGGGSAISAGIPRGVRGDLQSNPVGAPPLDWWEISEPCPKCGGSGCGRANKHPGRGHTAGLCYDCDCWSGRIPRDLERTSDDNPARPTAEDTVEMADSSTTSASLGETPRPLVHAVSLGDPLDWWNIPPGGYSGTTMWTERKPVNPRESLGDIQRTTSADCPLHAGSPDQVARAPHDEPLNRHQRNNPDNGNRRASLPPVGSVSTDQPIEPTLADGSWDSPDLLSIPAATRRSKASNKKVLAPATSSSDTASDKTLGRTGGTQAEPLSGEPRPDIQESRTSGVCLDGCSPGSCDHSFDRSSEGFDEACTCSYWMLEGKSTSHYAVWPPELCVKPIKAMCPEKVCRQCGEPRRRISEYSYEPDGKGTVGVRRDLKEPNGRTNGTGMTRGPSMNKVVDTVGFSDCGHNNWRPGIVLDPFVGSGTTLAVATGHGRDAVGIDLDERNYDLALQRVGPFLLELAEM